MGIINEIKKAKKNNNAIDEIIDDKHGLNNIKSKFLLGNIISYIKDENYKLKLFVHSKKYQEALNISLNNYKKKYFEKIGINILNVNEFFSLYSDYSFIFLDNGGYPGYYNKNYFQKNFEIFKKKYNNNIIQNYLIYYLEKNPELKNIYLDIYSPFFDILMKTNIFSDKFIIVIIMNFIKQNKLENDYINAFNKLNKLKNNYSLLFRFNESNDIDYFKTFKINLSSINKLVIFEDSYKDKNYDYFFGKFFSIKEIPKNILNLRISLKSNNIEAKLFQKLNSFNNLEHLELIGIKLNSLFVLNLTKLKTLEISGCNNISFSNNVTLNLTKLFFKDFMPIQQTILKFPKLEQCEFCQFFSNENHFNYNSIFDMSTMNNLKILKAEACDFLSLDNNALIQKLYAFSNDNNNIETEKKVIEKIISMKSLKEVNLILQKLDYNDISDIEGTNNSVTMIKIESKNQPKYNLFNLQKKFPNLSDIKLEVSYNENNMNDIEIIENEDCKINKIEINCSNANIKLFCQPFQNLEAINIIIYGEMNNIAERFPFFNDNCNISFDSLISFHFTYNKYINLDILYNLCNNLDHMKNLTILILDLKCKEVDKKYYDLLNKKLSILNLNFINCRIDNGLLYQEEAINLGEYKEEENINKFTETGIHIKI